MAKDATLGSRGNGSPAAMGMSISRTGPCIVVVRTYVQTFVISTGPFVIVLTTSIDRWLWYLRCVHASTQHSVRNCQGTFRAHSGNIQAPFREHSVRVERTPVSPRPNCKKHLKKVPRSTQDTTCPHEYLRRGLTRPNNVSQE